MAETISFLSYNIHRGIGMDGRFDAERIASVIRTLNPDVVALQEVANSYGGTRNAVQTELLADMTGMRVLGGPTLQRADSDYGNALLFRGEALSIRRFDLSFPRVEPRGAIDAELYLDGTSVRVIATHLGLRPAERRFQVRRLTEIFAASSVRPLVLMGDMNEWLSWGRPARWLHRYFGRLPAPRTFPSPFPLFALDRILVNPREALVKIRAIADFGSRVASDHLPLQALIATRKEGLPWPPFPKR